MKNRIKILLSLGWRAAWKALTARWPEKVARPTVRVLFLLYGIVTTLWAFTLSSPTVVKHHAELGIIELATSTSSSDISSILAVEYKLNKNYIAYLYRIVEKHSNTYHLDPLLVMSIMATESSFQASATSGKGCVGLMQIDWPVWNKELRRAGIAKSDVNVYDPNINIEAGCFIYNSLLNRNLGSNDRALNGYLGANGTSYRKNIYSTYGRLKLITSRGND